MTDEAVGTLVVVGHNPTVGMLAQLLDDGEGPPDAVDRLMQRLPDQRDRGLRAPRDVGADRDGAGAADAASTWAAAED